MLLNVQNWWYNLWSLNLLKKLNHEWKLYVVQLFKNESNYVFALPNCQPAPLNFDRKNMLYFIHFNSVICELPNNLLCLIY